MIRATSGLSRRTNQMDWQIGNIWTCPALRPGDLQWFADCRDAKIRRQNLYYLLMSRLGADLGPIRSEFAFDPI